MKPCPSLTPDEVDTTGLHWYNARRWLVDRSVGGDGGRVSTWNVVIVCSFRVDSFYTISLDLREISRPTVNVLRSTRWKRYIKVTCKWQLHAVFPRRAARRFGVVVCELRKTRETAQHRPALVWTVDLSVSERWSAISMPTHDTIRYGRLTCAQKLTRWPS